MKERSVKFMCKENEKNPHMKSLPYDKDMTELHPKCYLKV